MTRKTHTRKGQTYTLFTLAIIMSIITLINIDYEYNTIYETSINLETPTMIRTNMIASTVDDVKEDLSRSSYISTKRALFSLMDYSTTNNAFIANSRDTIIDVSQTGSYNSTQLALMENTTTANWTESIDTILNYMGVTSNITFTSYNLNLQENYQMILSATYSLNMSDPISKITVMKNTTQNITIDYRTFEDPLNTIKSNQVFGIEFSTTITPCNSSTYPKALTGTATSTDWTVGTALKSYDGTEIASIPEEDRAERILVTHNMSIISIPEINQFKGIITETSDQHSGVTIPMITTASTALSNTQDNYIIAMSETEDAWINNILTTDLTTCFIEHESAPTFFDRMEGNITRGKYEGPGIATFIDPTILPPNPGNELDFIYWQYA